MALSYNEYTANGTDVMFVSKPYLKEEHLAVYVDGVLQTPTSYTVSGTTVTFNSAPATNSVVRIGRSTNQESRLIDYQDGSLLTEAVLDADANQLFYMAQEAIDAAKETDLAGVTFYASSANAPANPSLGDLWYDQNNKYLKIFDGGAWKLATPANETHTFDNSFFNVSGSYSYINVANLTEDAFVFLNGVKQVKAAAQADVLVPTGGDYYLDLANSRVYLAPLDSTDTVEITIAPASLGETSNTRVETLIATTGQTVFDLTKPYIPGTNTLHVYVNGVRQSAYEETLSTRVTFTNGLSAGDEVTFITNQYTTTQSFSSSNNVTYTASGTGTVATTVEQKLQETVSVKDFGAKGDGVTDDTAKFEAARDANKPYVVPEGVYNLDTAFDTGSTPIIGLGASFNEGQPTTTYYRSFLDIGQKAINRKTARDSSEYSDTPTSYTYIKDLTSFNIEHYNGAGYQENVTNDHGGRTSVPAIYIEGHHYGYGDMPGTSVHYGISEHPNAANISGSWTGANSVVMYDGECAATSGRVNLYGAEYHLTDNGHERVAGNGIVLNFNRNNSNPSNSGQYNTVWSGIRLHTGGTYAADVGLSVNGLWHVGVDFSTATLSNQAAITLADDQRIYFGVPSGTPPSKWYADTLSDNYQTFDGTKHVFVTNNVPSLQISDTAITIDKVANMTESFNIPSTNNIEGTVGTAGTAASLPSKPFTYLKIQIDGVDYKLPVYNA